METIAPNTRIRPLMWILLMMAALGAIFLIAAGVAGGAALHSPRSLASGGSFLVVGGMGAIYLALWQANSRLLVGLDRFGYRDIFGRRHTWSASDVSAVIDVTIAYTKKWTQRAVFVLGKDGRRLMALNPLAWDENAIDRIARAAGKTIQIRAEPVSAVAFRREFPKAMPWVSAHPWLSGGVLGVGLMSFAVAIPIASVWLGPR